MKVITREKSGYIVRFETGEELIGALQRFSRAARLKGAWFWAIGAADRIEIAFYDLKKKKYIRRKISRRLEILNITGNIALRRGSGQAAKGKEIVVHAHGVFGKPTYATIGGHIISCRISATCEIYLMKLPALERRHDSSTGLNLLY